MSVASPPRPFGRLPAAPSTVSQRRRFALGGFGLAGVILGTSVLAAWAGAATYYILNSDDIAGRAIAGQRRMQMDYEERLVAMRAKLDQVASQKAVEQQHLETRVASIVGRQVELENRNQILAGIVARGGPAIADRRTAPSLVEASAVSAFAPTPKPALMPDPLGLRLRDAAAEAGAESARPRVLDTPSRVLPDRLSKLEHSLTLAALDQRQVLRGVAHAALRKASRFRAIIAETGIDPAGLGVPSPKSGIGGPFVPLPLEAGQGSFEAELALVRDSVDQLDRLRKTVGALPLGRPTLGDLDVTSGFGARLDPFTRSIAQHTGIDFRAEFGSPIRSTGAGQVITAGPSGGYGRMVEIDHGNGVTTRYAHLSGIRVVEGQSVPAGAIVGQAGSTGRSTGTHLHYETRIDGIAIDAQRFLKAGQRARLAEAD